MNHIKSYILSLFATLLSAFAALSTVSCTNDVLEGGIRREVISMRLDGGLQDYDGITTRASSAFPEGAQMLIHFSKTTYGTATYSSGVWTLALVGTLEETNSASCTLYYSPSPVAIIDDVLVLDAFSPLYKTGGSYSYAASTVTITATLTPATPRLRFRGPSGTSMTLSGLSHYFSVDVSAATAARMSKSLPLTVNGSYTDYVYGLLANENRELELTVNDVVYKRTIDSNLFKIGESGYMDIPTSSAPGNWTEVVNTHEYVDLGLSVMWATCNVGAAYPEENGDYYAWGETDTKNEYEWTTYKWCKGSRYSMTKYCTDSNYGTVDNKTQLDLEDDVAHVKWGGTWRMPTKAEQDELVNNCSWSWTDQGGRKGYKVTSKLNGNSIFLPAAGLIYGGSQYDSDSNGYYWSSSHNMNNWHSGYDLNFDSNGLDSLNSSRSCGQSVRPVFPNPSYVSVTSITLSRGNLEMTEGESFQLTATIMPSNATNKNVTWTSSAPDIASVSSNGMVTTKSAGSTTITVAADDDSGVTATCRVNVINAQPANTHEYVDLGLPSGTLWATCNVGAAKPEDYGDYFAWGDPVPYYTQGHGLDSPCTNWRSGKDQGYDWSSYKWCNGVYESLTKYCDNPKKGNVDNKYRLEALDDAATVNWGGEWHTPTRKDFEELINNCAWEWDDAKKLYKVTSTKTNKSILFPAAGLRERDYILFPKVACYYMSSENPSFYSNDVTGFLATSSGSPKIYSFSRNQGLPVRPVRSK